MKIAVAADERVGVAEAVIEELRKRGHEPLPHGALAEGERDDWAWASEAAARDVAEGRAEQAIVCCWTGTGASIAANKVDGVRAALCLDAQTADGRAQVERRQRPGDQPAGDLRSGARRDPRRLVRRGSRARRRTTRPTSSTWPRSRANLIREPSGAPAAPRRGRDDRRRAARRARPAGAGTPDRPYLILNFATTLDGRAAIDGRSGPIGSATDTEMLQRLRTRVDAVMIGAGTMRAERYGRIVSDPDLRAYREGTGLAQDPLAVIISNRLELPWDAGLFTDGGGRVVIFTASEARTRPRRRRR